MTRALTDKKEPQRSRESLKQLVYAVRSSSEPELPTYWLSYDASLDEEKLLACLAEILVDPVYQTALSEATGSRTQWQKGWQKEGFSFFAEKQFLPGVTDNLSHTIEEALRLKGLDAVKVASGTTYLFSQSNLDKFFGDSAEDGNPAASLQLEKSEGDAPDVLTESATYRLFHPLVETFKVHSLKAEIAESQLLNFPEVSLPNPEPPENVDLDLSDEELEKLSKDRLLALTLEEMKEVRNHFDSDDTKKARQKYGLESQPTDVELEVIAQTWSEHCKHKIFNAHIEYSECTEASGGSKPELREVKSLYKTYIKGATKELSDKRKDLLSVFEDNSGVVRWNDDWAVCFKVETHNSPSALEPYGGALTGILGVNRDILGTGLGAKPIFNTDVFCFAHPERELADRPKLLPPGTILKGVRKGVEDGGNKSGIPTVNGAIVFDDSYRAKPLVFCGTGGILPIERDGLKMYEKHTRVGDRVVMVGGRVGRDGIHGATFSSESLHEGSPVTAVQIGDPFTQKRVLDFVLAARDQGLITGITDNGAGGLSSSVGEMATITNGVSIDLDKVPLKYPGLSDWQIVVSESQERMTISTKNVDELIELGRHYGVEVSDIGEFDDSGYFKVTRGDRVVALLSLEFLHDGVPTLQLKARWQPPVLEKKSPAKVIGHAEAILELLAHPNISSREEVIRQYDHEVQGASVIKPLMGAEQTAPCDAAVIKPLLGEPEGLVVSNGICPTWSRYDAYLMAVLAVDEAVRNAVCVGANPDTIALLDNFCWPDPVLSERNSEGDFKLGQLVRTCHGLYDACIAFGAPLISGKDSMKNDFDDGVCRLSILPTLLVSAIGRIENSDLAVSMDLKEPGDIIYLLQCGSRSLTGSLFADLYDMADGKLPSFSFEDTPSMYRAIHELINEGVLASCHDVSEGGLAVAIAESCIGGGLGAEINLDSLAATRAEDSEGDEHAIEEMLFGEGPATLIATVSPDSVQALERVWKQHGKGKLVRLGEVTKDSKLAIKLGDERDGNRSQLELPLQALKDAWKKPLPF